MAYELKRRGHEIDCVQFAAYPTADELPVKTEWTLRSIDRFLNDRVSDRHPWFTTYGRSWFNHGLYRRWRRVTHSHLKEGYDAVIATNICATPAALAAIDDDIPSIIATTGPATLKYDPDNTKIDKTPIFLELPWTKKIQYPFIKRIHKWNEAAFTNASAVVSMSEFDAEVVYQTFGRQPIVNYIPVKLTDFRVDKWEPSKITLVNPRDKHKGLDMFLKIARRFPDESFQIAGSLYDDSKKQNIREIDNAEYLGWCDDMRTVYETTKLLLMPSTYQEGGGRVVIEGFVNGIPAIGSDIGGIPDYIGEGGDVVEEYNNPDAWTKVVERYISNEEYYNKKSQKARKRSQLFDFDSRIDRFEDILRTVIADQSG